MYELAKEKGNQYKTQIKNNMDNATPGQGMGGHNSGNMSKNQRKNCF